MIYKRIISLMSFIWPVVMLAQPLPPTKTKPKPLVSNLQTFTITKEDLQDKIKGGWAGQTIGVTFGGPTEFQFKGTMINDYQPIDWYDGYLKKTYTENPGLYDDIYMDLTFVDVFEKHGLDAPVDSFAQAFARAGYTLWHANQMARYNILNGIKPPQSGYWLNNPQADAIDFQIEADFAGLMSPGMPQTASTISDKIGHIMNYGDGWYGGVYVANMYALAFISNDIRFVVNEALKSIPQSTNFYNCISDVIRWHKQYPNDWRATWFEVQKKWSDDIGCPQGVFNSFNIDATLNAAYVVIGLLYGNGNYTQTLEIATRCGQDSDCNPSTAGGILGTIIGYKNIPDYWKQGLAEVEPIDFQYTTLSLNDVYEISFRHALQVIAQQGGKIEGNKVVIRTQPIKTVKFEQSFAGYFPFEKIKVGQVVKNEYTFDFTGTAFVVGGGINKSKTNTQNQDVDLKAELYIDGQLVETSILPSNSTIRKFDLFWRYQLPKQKHTVTIKLIEPSDLAELYLRDIIIYNNKPYSAKNALHR